MAPYYFWNDQGDNDWECAVGPNWRSMPGGGGILYTAGEIQPGDGDTITIQQDCTTNADHSGITFADLDVDAGKTLTIASGGDIRFDTNSINIAGKVSIATGGHVRTTDVRWTIAATGETEFDGGTLRHVTTAGFIYVSIFGSITGTSNAGNATGDLIMDNAANAQFRVETNGVSIIGDSVANRLVLNLGAGASKVVWNQTKEHGLFKNLDIHNHGSAFIDGGTFDGCLFHGESGDVSGIVHVTYTQPAKQLVFRDCFFYYSTGCRSERGQPVSMYNCVFGEDEDQNSKDNTQDFYKIGNITCHNCLFSSTTFISNDDGGIFNSTAHDQDETDWMHRQGRLHVATPEFGAGAQGGSGTAVKCVSGPNAADTDASRFRRLVAVIPATHGDVIDVTLYIKAITGTATLRIDPDSVYGTTQSVGSTGDNNWNQETIPSYTVNVSGGAGTKVSIPIYLDMTGPNQTWYYDTLDWTIS